MGRGAGAVEVLEVGPLEVRVGLGVEDFVGEGFGVEDFVGVGFGFGLLVGVGFLSDLGVGVGFGDLVSLRFLEDLFLSSSSSSERRLRSELTAAPSVSQNGGRMVLASSHR